MTMPGGSALREWKIYWLPDLVPELGVGYTLLFCGDVEDWLPRP